MLGHHIFFVLKRAVEERMLQASLVDRIDLSLKLIPKAHIIITITLH